MHRGTLAVLAMSGLILVLHAPTSAQTQASRRNVAGQAHSNWNDYAGAADGSQYSSLSKINRSNVRKLKVAWSYPVGDGKKYLFNPLVVDRTMYVLAHNDSI